jgi:integrase
VPYHEKPELDALLAAPNIATEQGRRDHGVLSILYNSGARASEATRVTIGDIEELTDGIEPGWHGELRLLNRRHVAQIPAQSAGFRLSRDNNLN